MKLFYILTFVLTLISYGNKTNNQSVSSKSITPSIDSISEEAIGDSIYKIGDFLFEAKKNAKFEFVTKGLKPKLETKGDTLYSDDQIVMLGDIQEIVSPGIYKKFAFKSQFDNYKVDRIYKGQLAKPNFRTDQSAKTFITRIQDGCKEMGVNFAGHYTIVEWGCGTQCLNFAIVDRISGKIIFSQFQSDTIEGHFGIDYRIDSRMIIMETEAFSEYSGYEMGYRRFDFWRQPVVYEMEDGRLKQIE